MGKIETIRKLPAKPFTGAEGNTFSKDNQPDPALKKAGWEEWRKKRFLTQSVIKEMISDDGTPKETLKEYITALISNAKLGNPKAIDAVNKCLEDEIIKVAQTNSAGEDAKTELTDSQFDKLLSKINATTNPG